MDTTGYKKGQRIQMLHMKDDPDPILPGTVGTITSVCLFNEDETILGVNWDNGRTLSVIVPIDWVRILRI